MVKQFAPRTREYAEGDCYCTDSRSQGCRSENGTGGPSPRRIPKLRQAYLQTQREMQSDEGTSTCIDRGSGPGAPPSSFGAHCCIQKG